MTSMSCVDQHVNAGWDIVWPASRAGHQGPRDCAWRQGAAPVPGPGPGHGGDLLQVGAQQAAGGTAVLRHHLHRAPCCGHDHWRAWQVLPRCEPPPCTYAWRAALPFLGGAHVEAHARPPLRIQSRVPPPPKACTHEPVDGRPAPGPSTVFCTWTATCSSRQHERALARHNAAQACMATSSPPARPTLQPCGRACEQPTSPACRRPGEGPGAAPARVPLCLPSRGESVPAGGQGCAGLPVPQPHPQGPLRAVHPRPGGPECGRGRGVPGAPHLRAHPGEARPRAWVRGQTGWAVGGVVKRERCPGSTADSH